MDYLGVEGEVVGKMMLAKKIVVDKTKKIEINMGNVKKNSNKYLESITKQKKNKVKVLEDMDLTNLVI